MAARGPGDDNWNFAVVKSIPVQVLGERAGADLRTEFFNPEYNNPSTAANSVSYGQITSSAGSPRLVQFALKLSF